MNDIYKAINATMQDIGVVGKTSRNTQQGFMFRGIDAVMNALNPAMVKNGIFVVPEVLDQVREERTSKTGGLLIYSICKIKFTFYAEDGSSVSAVIIGEGMDSGDKATNKAMSIAFKYACFQVFCIPTEEMRDPDAEIHEPKPKNNIENEKISSVKVKSLLDKCSKDKVDINDICEKMKVKTLADLTEKQFSWIANNWTKEFLNGASGQA